MCRPRTPKAVAAPPAPPPPPPAPAPTTGVTAETAMADAGSATEARRREALGYSQRAKRKGTSMLKIRLAENVGGGSGSNVGY